MVYKNGKLKRIPPLNKLKMCYEWIRIFLISAKADGEIVLNALLSDIELRSVKADRVV